MRRIVGYAIGLIILFLFVSCGFKGYSPGNLSTEIEAIPDQLRSSEGFWSVEDGMDLYHFNQGLPDAEPVLMIHGGPGMPFIEPWPGLEGIPGREFHYYQQRGSGRSTRPFDRFESGNYGKNMAALAGTLGLPQLIKDIERIRLILGVEKLTIVGHSFGGFQAVLYAAEFPERVDKLILVEPADMLVFPQEREGLGAIRSYLNESDREDFDAYMKDYFDFWNLFKQSDAELAEMVSGYGEYYAKALAARYPGAAGLPETDITTTDIGGFASYGPFMSQNRKYDFRPYLEEVKAPTLILRGESDLYSPEVCAEYATLLSDSEYHEIKGATHFPFVETPEEFRQIVEEFLLR